MIIVKVKGNWIVIAFILLFNRPLVKRTLFFVSTSRNASFCASYFYRMLFSILEYPIHLIYVDFLVRHSLAWLQAIETTSIMASLAHGTVRVPRRGDGEGECPLVHNPSFRLSHPSGIRPGPLRPASWLCASAGRPRASGTHSIPTLFLCLNDEHFDWQLFKDLLHYERFVPNSPTLCLLHNGQSRCVAVVISTLRKSSPN